MIVCDGVGVDEGDGVMVTVADGVGEADDVADGIRLAN